MPGTLTFEAPTVPLPDGRIFLSDMAIADHGLQDFVARFSNYWQRDDLRCGYVGPARSMEAIDALP